MQKITRLPRNQIVGKHFLTDEAVAFVVEDGEYFPQDSIARQHRKYCEGLALGQLVSLSFHGSPVPVIGVRDGVYRLKRIRLANGEAVDVAKVMSEKLNITETRQPRGLFLPAA